MFWRKCLPLQSHFVQKNKIFNKLQLKYISLNVPSGYECRVSSSGRTEGDPFPLSKKNGSSLHFTLLFCPKNVDFVIFMQFLTILPKMSLVAALFEQKWKTL